MLRSSAKEEWFKDVPVSKDQKQRGLKTLNYPNATATRHSKRFVTNMKRLDVRSSFAPAPADTLQVIVPPTGIANQRFLDLLGKLLKWDPNQRITPHAALSHPFFAHKFEDDGTALPVER